MLTTIPRNGIQMVSNFLAVKLIFSKKIRYIDFYSPTIINFCIFSCVPIGGPPGPDVSIYAIDDAGQYSEYLKFKVPDNAYDCPYDS